MSSPIFSFSVLLGLSFMFSTFLSRIPLLRIPTTVGYLFFGMVLHGTGISISHDTRIWINQLGEFGLLFLMFVSGLEVDLKLLRQTSPNKGKFSPFTVGLIVFSTTLVISFACCIFVSVWCPGNVNPYFLALLFSTTSLGIILPVLDEAGIVHSLFGQTLLISALLADFATMVLVSIFVSRSEGANLLGVVIAMLILPVAWSLYRILRQVQKVAPLRRFAGDPSNRMRGIVALLAGACAFADLTGAEPILGSFVVGMMISAMPFATKTKLKDYIHGIGYGFLIPVFFLSVGLNFEVNLFQSNDALIWLPILCVIAIVVKLLPSLSLSKTFGKRNALAGGMLLCSRLSLPVAAAQIGVGVGALPQFIADEVILVALLTSLLSPILFLTTFRRLSM